MHFSRKNFRNYLLLKSVNRFVRVLTLSDIILVAGFGLLTPIFAVYVTQTIAGASVEVVGIATTIFLISKSIGQIFAAELVDRIKGEKDDFISMFVGTLIVSFLYLSFIWITSVSQLYFIQFLIGLATAFTFPSWMAIFTRHIDKDLEGREWGMYYTLTDLTAAATAAVGGVLAYNLGFKPVFVMVALIGILGSFSLLLIRKQIFNKK